jgi:membrane associated rhomboid family serine protease
MGTYYRYQRSSINFGGMTLTPAVKILLIVNAGLYVVPALFGLNLYVPLRLYLVPAHVLSGMVWQLFTYMFFHGGFFHFLFNMLTLWMFGTAVEQTWGTRRFAFYYLVCGMFAGLCVVVLPLLAYAFTGSMRDLFAATIGSSGAIYGLILAFGLLFPEVPILMMFLFPIPAKYFAILMAGIEFFLQWSQPGSGVSHIAHLGGMLFGLVYIKFYLRRRSRARRVITPVYDEEKSSRWRFDLKGAYRRWKIQRARKKFEVYMRQHQDQDDRWIH